MAKSITRRDFLNGAALAVAAGATLSPRDLMALEASARPGKVPPLTRSRIWRRGFGKRLSGLFTGFGRGGVTLGSLWHEMPGKNRSF